MVRWTGRLLAVSVAVSAFGLVAFVGCGGDDGETTYNSGTGGTAGSGGSATGGTGATSGTGGSGGGALCGPGTTDCAGTCVDTMNNPAHCGTCNAACPQGQVCSVGQCSLFCSGGTTNCNGACVNTSSDAANCGTCGNACAAGQVCTQGTCASSCTGGTTECNGACVNTNTDTANCGTCGNACEAGQVCSAGVCGVSCGSGTEECDGECVDTDVDPAHCGDCDTACPTGQVCSVGVCTVNCAGGTTECSGLCVNTDTDPNNCGDCGTECPDGEACSAGVCGVTCSGGTTKCDDLCVDTDIDPTNCGACGVTCQAGQVCNAGACGLVCTGGTIACGGICINPANDPANCGGCDQPCPTGEVCSGGVCGLSCTGGSTLCTGACVDTDIDPNNCGTCGTVCGSNQACVNGICTGSCGGGLTLCNGFCVNTATDVGNCGACGTVCAAGQNCITGVCTACDSATTDCDSDGWLLSQGDCCDKPGLCGAEPGKVNPGAIEVLGNGIDDNCNGKTDLFDQEDTAACDSGIESNTTEAVDYAKALGICRTTTEAEPLATRTWGLISAQLVRADGTAVTDARAHSIRADFGAAAPMPLEGQRIVVLSTGIAADADQTNPGPNTGPTSNPATSLTGASVNISTCTNPLCIKDWYATPNLPLKPANGLPDAPGCNASNDSDAEDSVMLVLRMRAPTNAKAFSFNSYFYSSEYPEFVCTSFNDQFIALVNTPTGTPTPIANPVDKNLMTYTKDGQKWPIGINIAKGTTLFSVCEPQGVSTCWDTDVSADSCSLGAAQLLGTGFEAPSATSHCTHGGGTYWLTTAGNVIPGQVVELRIAIWDVGDKIYDSLALVDGFRWLYSATLPGTN